jgi:hypothetical protein
MLSHADWSDWPLVPGVTAVGNMGNVMWLGLVTHAATLGAYLTRNPKGVTTR